MIIFKYLFLVLGAIFLSSTTSFSLAAETALGEGAVLYHDYCSVCHGDKGDGKSRAKGGLSTHPRDFTQPGLSKVLTRESMVNIVLNGRPGTAMAGWGTRLSHSQAESVVDFVRNNFMSASMSKDNSEIKDISKTEATKATEVIETTEAKEPHKKIVELSMPNGLTGDSEKGKLFYNDNCSTCHGASGDGDGPRAYFIFPKPRNFLSEDSKMRLNRIVLFNAIKHGVRGKEMPAWGKVLDDQQIANVTEYVFKTIIK